MEALRKRESLMTESFQLSDFIVAQNYHPSSAECMVLSPTIFVHGAYLRLCQRFSRKSLTSQGGNGWPGEVRAQTLRPCVLLFLQR